MRGRVVNSEAGISMKLDCHSPEPVGAIVFHSLVITALSNLPSGLQQAVLFVSDAFGGGSDVAEGFESRRVPYQIAAVISIIRCNERYCRESEEVKSLAVTA